ncbi:MAG: hypothetical protein H5T59_10575 [Anaerolineae bacterium]|nr:hypothetical protein [Anaerolineae bacterium]
MERLKRIAVIGLVAFSATLSVLVLKELSTDATAMLIGVGCGVLSSLPLGVGLLVWSVRSANAERERATRTSNSPVIIVSGGQALPGAWGTGPMWAPPPREFVEATGATYRVLGEPGEEQGAGWEPAQVLEGTWSPGRNQTW